MCLVCEGLKFKIISFYLEITCKIRDKLIQVHVCFMQGRPKFYIFGYYLVERMTPELTCERVTKRGENLIKNVTLL